MTPSPSPPPADQSVRPRIRGIRRRRGIRGRSFRRRLIYFAIGFIAILILALLLFACNGLILADRNSVRLGVTAHPAAPGPGVTSDQPTITILSFNIAKLFFQTGDVSFTDPRDVRARLRRVAAIINDQHPDLVFLSETVRQCSPAPVDQVSELADLTGMHAWAFGENYNVGLPFYRVVGGNAILSRRPLTPIGNPDLAGRQSFWVTKNNRRSLWCAMGIHGQRVQLAAVHNDSFNPRNNLAQARQLLDWAGDKPTILAGDFNANPDEPSIQLLKSSGRFVSVFDGPKTFPSTHPDQTIDFIFAPASWQVVEHRVIYDDVSDHRAICTVFHVAP